MKLHHHYNPSFIHHRPSLDTSIIREAIFGMEDGMVSTFGAITGIAAATRDPFVVVLSGLVIISVESISMGVGSYLSSKSEQSINERKLDEEREELRRYPAAEKKELFDMYLKDGWPRELSEHMVEAAANNRDLFLKEMAYRELKVFPEVNESPTKNAVSMLFSYIVGGFIPLSLYLFFPLSLAIPLSVVTTLIGLFALGALTTRFSNRLWWRAGFEMLILASLAGAIGYAVGQMVDSLWLK